MIKKLIEVENSPKYLIPPSAKLGEAKNFLFNAEYKLLIVSENGKNIIGVLSEGDIRRAEQKGIDNQTPIIEVCNRIPLIWNSKFSESEIIIKMKVLALNVVPKVDEFSQFQSLFFLSETKVEAVNCCVVIMAGGKGARLKNLTSNTPKSLLLFGGHPIIEILVNNLSKQGFKSIYISVNHMKEQIMDLLGNGIDYDTKIQYIHEPSPLGTAGSLAYIDSKMSNHYLVINSDILSNFDFEYFLNNHIKEQNDMTIGCINRSEKFDYGIVQRDSESQYVISEKPTLNFLTFAGVSIVNRNCLPYIKKDQRLDITDFFNNLKDHNKKTGIHVFDDYWRDLGTLSSIQNANLDFFG